MSITVCFPPIFPLWRQVSSFVLRTPTARTICTRLNIFQNIYREDVIFRLLFTKTVETNHFCTIILIGRFINKVAGGSTFKSATYFASSVISFCITSSFSFTSQQGQWQPIHIQTVGLQQR